MGTWRSWYRKRFPSSIYTSSNVNASGQRTSVIHVDMDCFFVSVVIRNHPELQDKSVALCHSDNPRPQGTAEISSTNYSARSYDVKDIRGMGLQVSKLESVDTAKQGSFHLF